MNFFSCVMFVGAGEFSCHNKPKYDRRRGLSFMTATMSKTSWFKRNGGKDAAPNHGPKEKESNQQQQPSSSKLFKALRMGSASSLSAKSQSSSSPYLRSSGSSSSPSYTLPSPSGTSSTSDRYSSGLPSLSNTPTSIEYTTAAAASSSRAGPSSSQPSTIGRSGSSTELRPSQEDPFANLSSPHVRFTDTPVEPQRYISTKAATQPTASSSSSFLRRPSALSTTKRDANASSPNAARKRVISSPDGSQRSSSHPNAYGTAGPSVARTGTARLSPTPSPAPVAHSSPNASTSGPDPAAASSMIVPILQASTSSSSSSISPNGAVRYVFPSHCSCYRPPDSLSQFFCFPYHV